jgi:hypothetical protein
MFGGFPASVYRSIASQIPMFFCAASNASTCTRTGDVMSSIVLLRQVVSAGWEKLAKNCTTQREFTVD